MRIVVSFEWGGRPIIFDSEGGNGFTASLIMATLDYKLLRNSNNQNHHHAAAAAAVSNGGNGNGSGCGGVVRRED